MNYLVIIIVYLAALVCLGIYLSRKSVKTSDDFVVAGRQLPFFILIGTLLATWCGGGGITGSANFIYSNGPFAGMLHFMGPPLGIIALYFIAGKVREKANYTIPELFETRYGTTARFVSSCCIIIAYTGIVSTQFMASGRIISMTTGLGFVEATLIAAVFIVLLTVSGGLLSVAYSDAFGALVMIGGFALAIPILFKQVGGLQWAFANLPAGKNTFTGNLTPVQLLGYILPSFFLIMGDQNLIQRFGAAKDKNEAQKSNIGLFFAEMTVIVTSILIVTAGIFLIPATTSPDTIIFQLAMNFLPFIFGAALLAACISFVITTADSFLLSAATNLTYDIWVRFINKDASDKQKLMFIRMVICALAVVAFVMGIYFPSILSLQMYSYTMYGAAITPALLCALFSKKIGGKAGLCGIIAGGAITLLWDAVLSSPGGIRSVIISVPFSFLVIFIVNALVPEKV